MSKGDETSNDTIKSLNRLRGSIKSRLTIFKNYVYSFESLDITNAQRAELKLRSQSVKKLYNDFNDIQNKIESLLPTSELDAQFTEREKFENDYYSALARTECMINEDEHSNKSTSVNNNTVQSVKLPTIALPTFDGNYEHWLEFRDTYLALVHDSSEISDIQKFHYLKSSLYGDAQLVIDSVEFSAQNYSIAWELLTKRFNNSKLLIHNHIKSLFSIPIVNKESPSLIRKLIDTVLKNIRALKLLGESTEHWDTLVIYLVVSKLDSATEREWEQYKCTLCSADSDSSTKIKLNDLIKFLRDKADMLDTLHVSHSKLSTSQSFNHNKHPPTYTHTHSKPHHKVHCNIAANRPKSRSYNRTPRIRTCILCNANHSLYFCQQFINLNLQDKLKLIKDKHLCENCLHFGHTVNDCRYSTCRKCDKKHNTLIHREEGSESHPEVHTLSTLSANEYYKTSNNTKPLALQASINDTITLTTQSHSHFVLLSTAMVEVADSVGTFHKVRAILDSGSERSFISQNLCNKLQLKFIQSTSKIHGIGNVVTKSTQNCDVEVRALHGTFFMRISCIVLPQITSSLPTFPLHKHKIHIPAHIQLADPMFYESQPVDLLIGADRFWNLLQEGKMRLPSGPFLQNTSLGWVISGPIYQNNKQFSQALTCNFTSLESAAIEKQLRRFWELEELSSSNILGDTRGMDERQCEEHFLQTTKRDSEGRFCVQIPFKQSPDMLGESYSYAERRFVNLEKRLDRNPAYKQLYSDFIHEYINLGHMSRIESYSSPHCFLPHHGVFREHSTTTRLRVVFDGSAETSNGTTLNSLQLIGEPLQGDLISILLRFREKKYVACADIEKMYRQVLVDPTQRDLQLILWRDNSSEKIDIYQLNTVTYGTASAPYLSCRCLKQLAHECNDPEIARVINNDFYVDDLICGEDSIDKLLYVCEETVKTLNKGCFSLRKWIFNFDHNIYISNSTVKNLTLGDDAHSKTLGIGWHSKSDNLHFHTHYEQDNTVPTKRIILSKTSQIFDPLGLLSPTIITAKILLQKLWLLHVDWDEKVPDDIARSWLKFVSNLSSLSNISIPRYVFCDNAIYKELHIFTDASQVAYGACAYVRSVDKNSAIIVKLLCSKAKVAPLTPMTVPRLELCGARLGARLYTKIKESLRDSFNKIIFWTDSTIVLGWLHMSPNLLKTYVQNRVSEIHELTKDNLWRHVKGRDNPADLVSRGLHLDALIYSTIWWNGPAYLHDHDYDCSYADPESNLAELPEIKSNAIKTLLSNQVTKYDSLFTFNRFSQFNRMQRAASYVLRFVYNIRNKQSRRSGSLSADELRESLLVLARLSQREAYSGEYKALANKETLRNYNKIINLNLFLDQNGLIRVGGRILNSNIFNYDKKHPILLSSKHHFTVLLFRHHHRTLLHAAPQLLLYSIRDMWWPVGGRGLARKIVHNCIICSRMRAKIITPIMGNLPTERIDPGFPFIKCGVDYAGPVLILNRKGRGAKTIKSYICLFICFVTRAIHLELVSDLSSDAYLLALKRFISRRGKPTDIFSDNGRNFVGVMHDFSNFLLSCSDHIKDYAASQNIRFHFIPPYASHFGGLWEAGVKSCKHHLRRVVGNAHLTFEEFNTVLIQIEAVLNSRPLSLLSSDPDDLQPLSPAHFLIGRSLTTPVTEDLKDEPMHLLTRWQKVEQMKQHFWVRWSKEFISDLQTRTKWKEHTGDLAQHTVVLIKDDNTPPLKWNLGRIIKTFPGHDGVSRVADIKTSNGIIRRAFSKICPLPVNGE